MSAKAPIEARAAAEVRGWRRRMLRGEAQAGGVVNHGDMTVTADHAVRFAIERTRRAFAADADPARLALVLSIIGDLGDVARSIAAEADALAHARDAAEAADSVAKAEGGKERAAATNPKQKADKAKRAQKARALLDQGMTKKDAAERMGITPRTLGRYFAAPQK